MSTKTEDLSDDLPSPLVLGVGGFVGLWGTSLVLAKALPTPLTATLILVSYSMHAVGAYISLRALRKAKVAWPGLVINLLGLMLPPAVAIWWFFGLAPLVSEVDQAAEFMEQRGVPLPASAREVAFAVDDDLRTVAFFVRFDLPFAEAQLFQQKLWCRPTEPILPEAAPPASAPWFTVEGMTNAQRCDTNGPFRGPYHVDIAVGRTPSGYARFLLSFSD